MPVRRLLIYNSRLADKVAFDKPPFLYIARQFPVSGSELLDYITDYAYRHHWIEGVDKFEFNENEVTRIGSEHVCVINGKHLNFVTVTKMGKPGQLVYGELTTSIPLADEMYQFYIITPLTSDTCKLEVEIYFKARSPIKKLAFSLVGKSTLRKNLKGAMERLWQNSTQMAAAAG